MSGSTENIAMWEIVRTLWASGRYATLSALHRESVRLYGSRSPTLLQIRRKADREIWTNDAEVSDSLQRETQRTASEILNEFGMGIVRRCELIAEMAEGPHRDYDRIRGIIDGIADQIRAAGGEVDQKALNGALKELGILYQKGCRLSLDAIRLAFEIEGGSGKGGHDQGEAEGKPLDDRPPEEIQAEIEKMIKSMAHRYINKKDDAQQPE